MIFNSRVVPVFVLQMANISGLSIGMYVAAAGVDLAEIFVEVGV